MTSLVKERFAEWTKDLDTHQSMISIFTHIRDIPYSLSHPMPNPKTSPEQLLVAGKGSCGPKHYLLAEMFRKLNLNVVYATIAFSWNDPDLHYSPDLRKLAARLPIAHHLACRVQIGCRWILVDATWDPPLAKGGFLINDHWDGYSEMKWAVKPLKSPAQLAFCGGLENVPCRSGGETVHRSVDGEKNHWDVEDQARYYHEKVAVRTPDEVIQKAEFYRKFEEWMVEIRQQKSVL
jgi:hypothetical protein